MKNTKKGFTLVELLVVIAILAILATVSIVGYTSFIDRSNISVDEQFVAQLNKFLEAAEIAGEKPATIVDVQELFEENEVTSFKAHFARNTVYWVGTDNRVILWTADSKDALDGKGKVTYPEELAEKFSNYTVPSADWKKLDEEYDVLTITPAEGQSVKDALISALSTAEGDHIVVRLPDNSDLEASYGGLYYISESLRNADGTAKIKDVTIDMNGGIIICSGTNSSLVKDETGAWVMDKDGNYALNAIQVPEGGSLVMTNGTMKINGYRPSTANFKTEKNASLVLRNMNIFTTGATVFADSDSSEVLIEDCYIEGGYGVGTNAMSSSNVKITVRNSIIDASVPVLVNVPCELFVEGCTITGYNQAIIVRGGTATIKNNVIYNVADDTKESMATWWNYFMDDNGVMSAWSEGNYVPIAAITLGQDFDNNGNYQYPTNVTMSGNKIHVLENCMAVYAEGSQGRNDLTAVDVAVTLNESDNEYYYHDTSAWTNGKLFADTTPKMYDKDMTAMDRVIVYTNETGSYVTINGTQYQDGQ